MALTPKVQKIKNVYFRFERHISAIGLLAGFVFDILTLKRVDLFLENIWVLVHLIVVMLGIFLLNLYESGRSKKKKDGNATGAIHFWLVLITQFMFGGLLSTFLVFYFRSAALGASWPFLLILAIAFICNELLKEHYSRLVLQISMLFVSIYSFAIYILPVIFHELGPTMFILSGLSSLALIGLFLGALWLFTRERFRESRYGLLAAIGGIFIIINVLYATNLIPPLPLSLKDAGVYHSVSRDATGQYILEGESEGSTFFARLNDFFRPYPIYHEAAGKAVYIFSAVFSPTALNIDIVHNWQHYNETTKKWESESRVPLSIIGGRDGGYRTFSYKTSVENGYWRVDVETKNGQDIGRVKFYVVND